MNKQTVYILIGVAVVAGVGFYLWKKNQRQQVTQPQAPANEGNGNGNVIDELQNAWDIFDGIFSGKN